MLTTLGDGDTKKGKMRRVSCSYIFEWMVNHHLGGLGHRSRNNGGMTFMWLLWESAPYIGPEGENGFSLSSLFCYLPLPTPNVFHRSTIVLSNWARDLTVAGSSEVTWYTAVLNYHIMCWSAFPLQGGLPGHGRFEHFATQFGTPTVPLPLFGVCEAGRVFDTLTF